MLLFKRIAMSLSPSPSASDQPAIQKTVLALLLTQSIASAALLTSSTVNPIVSAQLSGQDALAGLPTALVLGGASLAAYPAGRFMGRYGRRSGLALGSVIGIAGAALSAGGVAVAAFPLFLLGLLLLGAGRGILDQGRYAAAEVNPPEHRGRASGRNPSGWRRSPAHIWAQPSCWAWWRSYSWRCCRPICETLHNELRNAMNTACQQPSHRLSRLSHHCKTLTQKRQRPLCNPCFGRATARLRSSP